jgi:hypothetical protein
LVVLGNQQREVNVHDLYAPTCRAATLRVFFAVVAARNYELLQVDISTAFLNGVLPKPVYMKQPQGFDDGTGRVWRLKKSVYGLRNAPKQWYEALSGHLRHIGFRVSESDPGLFVKSVGDRVVFLVVHVDDMLIASATLAEAEEVIRGLGQRFQVKNLGNASTFLGLEIVRDRSKQTLRLTQTQYVHEVMERFGVVDKQFKDTPMNTSLRLYAEPEEERTDKPYQELVGALLYLTVNTRPDAAHAVGMLGRFSSRPTESHWSAAKHVLKYFARTAGMGLQFEGTSLLHLVGSCDADYAGDKSLAKSTSGYAMRLGETVVSWKSKLQSTTSTSTTEAELKALSAGAREALWLRRVLAEFGIRQYTIPLQCDNQATLALVRSTALSDRSKHIDVQHFFVRERETMNEIRLEYVASALNVADVLTKPLARDAFAKHRTTLGVK